MVALLGIYAETNRPGLRGDISSSIFEHCPLITTSSTARGDGGSFKNRKPIGEIGCCESRKTKQIH